MSKIESLQPDNTERLLNIMATAIWSKGLLKEYNQFSKGNSAERKRTGNLVTQTAERLLENPQDISIAENVWRTNDADQDGAQEPKEPFSKIVKEKMFKLMKDEWVNATPDQLAGLVRIYANKDESQESARESAEGLLRNYFKGPENRNQRIRAYYNFVSGVLDLAGEDEVFREGMKIALHATDILPKSPNLTDQSSVVSLPSDREANVFKKVLVVNYVISQLRFMGLQDLEKYYDERNAFVNAEQAKGKFRNRQQRVTKEMGDSSRVIELNKEMLFFFRTITAGLISSERKQNLKGISPFNLAFDEDDPLNQKFNRILAENRYK